METIEDRSKEFMNKCAKFLDKYDKVMLRAFYDYWTEKNEKGRKMRFEMEKVFDISRRLATWKRNQDERKFVKSSVVPSKISLKDLE